MKNILIILLSILYFNGYAQLIPLPKASAAISQITIDSIVRMDDLGNIKSAPINSWNLQALENPQSASKTLTTVVKKGLLIDSTNLYSFIVFDYITKEYKKKAITDVSPLLTGNETMFNDWDKDVSNDFNGDYADLINIPTSFIPSVHEHSIAEITSLQSLLDNKQPLGTYASGTGSANGINTGDNAANTNYANDYRLANFVAGTNYIAPNGDGSALTNIGQNQITNLTTDLAAKASNTSVALKQNTLVSATNIKTINNQSVLGSGDLSITTTIDTSTNYGVMTRTKTDVLYAPIRSFVSGASSNTAITFIPITSSDFPVVAGGRYKFNYQIRYNSAAITTGAAFALFGNADVISSSIRQTNNNNTTALLQNFSGPITVVTPFTTSTNSKLTNNIAIIEGEIVANVNGFFQLYFASEVAGSAITIQTTSRKQYQRID